jgi:hypothetical protein
MDNNDFIILFGSIFILLVLKISDAVKTIILAFFDKDNSFEE